MIKNKMKFYKIMYSLAWTVIVLFLFVVIGLLLIANPKAVGIMVLYYSPSWLPIIVLSVLTVIYSNKLIKMYEKQV